MRNLRVTLAVVILRARLATPLRTHLIQQQLAEAGALSIYLGPLGQ